jgi:TPR repeat protein
MGFDPGTGDELLPVTKETVSLWRDQEKKRKEDEGTRKKDEARLAPHPIDPEKYDPFDPLSGKPRVWYSRSEEGEYQFYDNPGFDPRTGEALAIITRDVLGDSTKARRKPNAQSCYVITKDPQQPVQYRESPGIDPATGRQCRLVTPELLERLREYEKGNRPTRIQSGQPTFFDLRTGEPVVWYYKSPKEEIEIFDLMGFHPETGEELVPITKEIVALWQAQLNRHPPKQVDLKSYELFDPLTGEPRVWYWRGDDGKYEFYDNDGYHPRTGERLISLTKDAAVKIVREAEEREKQLEEERKQRELVAQKRTEQIEQDRKSRVEQEEKATKDRDLKRERESQAAEFCDQLAGNPTDLHKVGDGVSFDTLDGNARQAADYCELAAKQSPSELRFQYQWARALQHIDKERDRAFAIFQPLAKKRYPAAFDNLGWLFYSRHNIPEAVNHFRTGAKLGDPDSMVSLVEIYDRGYAEPRSEDEMKIVLLERAARLGQAGAVRSLEVEQEKNGQIEQQGAFQQEQARRVIEMFGGIIQGIQRR